MKRGRHGLRSRDENDLGPLKNCGKASAATEQKEGSDSRGYEGPHLPHQVVL